jgi:hypothetical protein
MFIFRSPPLLIDRWNGRPVCLTLLNLSIIVLLHKSFAHRSGGGASCNHHAESCPLSLAATFRPLSALCLSSCFQLRFLLVFNWERQSNQHQSWWMSWQLDDALPHSTPVSTMPQCETASINATRSYQNAHLQYYGAEVGIQPYLTHNRRRTASIHCLERCAATVRNLKATKEGSERHTSRWFMI